MQNLWCLKNTPDTKAGWTAFPDRPLPEFVKTPGNLAADSL
jgi:hypothetical protein